MVAAAGMVAGGLLFALPGLGSGISDAAQTTDSTPAAGNFPVTIPVNSSPPTPQYPSGYVALTFDDWPTKVTPNLLAALRKVGVKATFLDIGNHVVSIRSG